MDAFGPDLTSAVTMDDVVAFVKRTKPSELPPTKYAEIITILEYLKSETMRTHEYNLARAKELDNRAERVEQMEAHLDIRKRAIDLMLGDEPVKPERKFFWR
jgi:hypothetical protein